MKFTEKSPLQPFESKVRRFADRWAWLPIPLLSGAIIVLWFLGLREIHELPRVMKALNFIFTVAVSAIVAEMARRSFLERGAPELLLFCCGALFWGGSGLLGAVLVTRDVNAAITVHNLLVWFSAACHLTGAVLSLRATHKLSWPAVWQWAAFACVLLLAGATTSLATGGDIPVFFVQGQGGTPVRQFVLFSAITMFGVTSALLLTWSFRSTSLFFRWYGLAMALIACGLWGVMMILASGSLLGWAGRIAQYLGGVYMFVAMFGVLRENRAYRIPIERRLRESEAQFEAVFDVASVGIFQVDPRDGRFLRFNDRYREITGYSSDELLAMRLPDLIHPEDRERDWELFSLAAGGDQPGYRIEKRYVRKDGSTIWVSINSAFVRDAAGKAISTLSVCEEVTERRRMEEQLRRQNAVLNGIGRIFQEAITCETVEELGRTCLATAEEITGSRFGFIGELGDDGLGHNIARSDPGWELCTMHDKSGHPAPLEDFKVHGIYGRVLAEGKGLIANDPATHPNRIGLPAGHPPLESFLGAPLKRDGRTVGMIALANRAGGYRPEDLESLEALAPAVVEALDHKRADIAQKEFEDELRKQVERYDLVLAGANDAIWDWDVLNKRVHFSSHWKKLRGYADTEIGDSEEEWSKNIHPEDAPRVFAAVRAHFDGATPFFHEEYRIKGKDGAYKWILDRGLALRDAAGNVVRMAGSESDVTERKAAEEKIKAAHALAENERRRLEALMEALPVGVVLTDTQGGILLTNEMDHKIWGGSRPSTDSIDDYVEYKAWWADTGLSVQPEEWASARAARNGETVVGQMLKIQRFDGTQGFVLNSAAPVRDVDGRIVGSAVALLDVTELRRAEEALIKAREAAEAANRAKSIFLANMSHEIRTPMNGILGMIDLALKKTGDSRVMEYLAYAKESANRLLDIINDVLDLSKIEAGKLELAREPFSFNEFIESALEPFRSGFAAKCLDLECTIDRDIPNRIVGDAAHMRQVLTNLIGNALKFTEKGRATVSARLIGFDHGCNKLELLFGVRDTGIGISPKHLESIFENFVQAHTELHTKYDGAGLGLSISKNLVNLMGGKIWAESRVGVGSAFFFTVTLETAPEEKIVSNCSPASKWVGRPLSILVAEDTKVNQIYIKSLLEEDGHAVTIVETGCLALEQLAEGSFDIVLMDIRMPEMDGDEATRIIRQNPPPGVNPRIPIIALTAYALVSEREQFMESGFDAYLTKPVEIDKLYEIIAKVVQRN